MSNANTKALVASDPVWSVAPSLEEATERDVILLTREGHVLSEREVRVRRAGGWLLAGGVGALFGMSLGAVLGPALGALAAGGFLGALAWQNRYTPELRRAVALLTASRREEARALLDELEQRNLGWGYQAYVDLLRAKLSWQEGQFDEARRRYTKALDAYRARTVPQHNGMYWICLFDLAELEAASGNVERARQMRDELDGAPTGEYFRMERMLTDLLIAFHADAPQELPADELYEWAKTALRMNRWGTIVVLLAWAFERSGDEDMARHLLGEAPERLESVFAQAHPREHAWMMERRAAWKLDEEL